MNLVEDLLTSAGTLILKSEVTVKGIRWMFIKVNYEVWEELKFGTEESVVHTHERIPHNDFEFP